MKIRRQGSGRWLGFFFCFFLLVLAMACCFSARADSSVFDVGLQTDPAFDDDDVEIEFPKRTSNLHKIYEGDPHNKHRIALQDWMQRLECSERQLARKHANCSSARSDLYQILGLFFVFQGVILTAVAQASQLTCHNWFLPFLICLLSSIAAFGACLQKLKEISEFSEQHRLERALYVSLQKSIEKLKEEGTSFDVENSQPELKGRYTEAESSGRGSFDNMCSSFSHFCSVWILSYAGSVLFLLCLFSGLTLFSVPRILCNHGH